MAFRDRKGNICIKVLVLEQQYKQIPGIKDHSIIKAPSSGFTVDYTWKSDGHGRENSLFSYFSIPEKEK